MNCKNKSFLSRNEYKKVTTGLFFPMKNSSDFIAILMKIHKDLISHGSYE